MSSIQGSTLTSSSAVAAAGAVEISRDDAIRNLLSDDGISDFHLKGSDGTLVIANRSMLASRSPVFRRMLFGGGEVTTTEASKSVLELEYSSQVLKNIVECVYTDDAHVFHTKAKSEGGYEAIVPTMVALVDAAHYYELPNLRIKAEEFTESMVHEDAYLAVSILKACQNHATAVGVVQEMCLTVIKSSPRVFLKDNISDRSINGVSNFCPSIISMMSSSQVETLLKDDKVQGDELTLFLMLQAWANGGGDDEVVEGSEDNGRDEEDAAGSKTKAGRTELAIELAKNLHLELIDPVELSTIVARSGLVSPEQLCSAYESQALKARHKRGIQYNTPRFVAISELDENEKNSGGSGLIAPRSTSHDEIYADDDFEYHLPRSAITRTRATTTTTPTPRSLFSSPRGLFEEQGSNDNDWNSKLSNGFLKLFCPPSIQNSELPRFWNNSPFVSNKKEEAAGGGEEQQGRSVAVDEVGAPASQDEDSVNDDPGQSLSHPGDESGTVEVTFEAMTSYDESEVLSAVPHYEENENTDDDGGNGVFEDSYENAAAADGDKHGVLGPTEQKVENGEIGVPEGPEGVLSDGDSL